MADPEIRINILREKSELHIFIEQLAYMTPHEAADLVEEIAGILRTLPNKPIWQISADDPELTESSTLSHHTDPLPYVRKE
ncbi:MAG TPA: hypothetical protein VHV10_05560 [Ktedonobacteraceae bacterium]|nr:hypothetical protein [Ktedonobacteraceae bacterium]